MKKIGYIILMSISFFVFEARSSIVTKHIPIQGFTGIKVVGNYRVVINLRSGEPDINIQGIEAAVELLQVKNIDNDILIDTKRKIKKNNSKNYDVTIFIGVDMINKLDVVGNSSVYFVTGLKGDNLLSLSVRGNADLYMQKVDIPYLKFESNGNADVKIDRLTVSSFEGLVAGNSRVIIAEGTINSAKVSVKGNGVMDTRRVLTNKLNVRQDGVADIYCNVLEELNGSVNGSGHVYYYGNPLLVARDDRYFAKLD